METNNTRILLVDANQHVLETNRGLLSQDQSFHVTTATTPEDAIALIRQQPFDLVIADQPQPDPTDALAVFEEARRANRSARTALLANYPALNSPQQIVMAQVDQLTLKPTTPNQLIQNIKNLLKDGSPNPQEQGGDTTDQQELRSNAGEALAQLSRVVTEQCYVNMRTAYPDNQDASQLRQPERTAYIQGCVEHVANQLCGLTGPEETMDTNRRFGQGYAGFISRTRGSSTATLLNEAQALKTAISQVLGANGIDDSWVDVQQQIALGINGQLAETIDAFQQARVSR